MRPARPRVARRADPAAGKGPDRRLARVGLLCAAALVTLGPLAYYQFGVLAPWRRSQASLRDHDFAQARHHLRRCLERWPDSGEVHLLMARACRCDGDLTAAQHHLAEARRLQAAPQAVQLESTLVQAQSSALRLVEQQLLDQMAGGHPDGDLIVEALVLGYTGNHLWDKAHRACTLWADTAPGQWYPRYLRGVNAQLSERADLNALGVEDLREVLRQRPGFASAHLHLGKLLVAAGRHPEALPHFRAYHQRRPDDSEGARGVALCLRLAGLVEEATNLLDDWLAHHPHRDARVLLLRGQLALDSGRPSRRGRLAAPVRGDRPQQPGSA